MSTKKKPEQPKATRRARAAGALPAHLNPDRSLTALTRWKKSQEDFASAYERIARRGGLRRAAKQLRTAYAEFQMTDFMAVCKAINFGPQRATTPIGRMVVYWATRD